MLSRKLQNAYYRFLTSKHPLLTVSYWGFPGGSAVQEPPAVQEMRVQSLGGEDPLEQEMATPSSILAEKSHGWRSLGAYSPLGHKKSHSRLSD